jgi:hypothetical protein
MSILSQKRFLFATSNNRWTDGAAAKEILCLTDMNYEEQKRLENQLFRES